MPDVNYADDTAQRMSDRSVEEVWVEEILKPRGISEGQAMDIVARIQAHPQLRSRLPTATEVDKYVTEAIQKISFEENDLGEDRDEIVSEMLDVLKQGIDDQRPGPVSLPMSERSKVTSTADGTKVETDTSRDDEDQSGDGDADTATVNLSDPREALGMDVGGENANRNAGILAANAGIVNAEEGDADEREHENLDEIREEHGRDETEPDDGPAVSEAQLRSTLTDFLGVSECYTVALRDLVVGEGPGEVTELLERAWTRHDQAETDQERRDATAAGVLLQAHAELGLDEGTSPNQDRLAEAVDQWTEEFPEAVLAAHEAIEGGESPTKTERLRASVDTDEFTREDLETLVFSQLIDEIERSVTDVYIAALRSVLDGEAADAVRAFAYAWQNRSVAADEDEHRDGVAGGVGLLAHVSLGIVDDDIIDETTVIEEVAINRQALGDAVVAVYEAAVDRMPSSSPEELRETVDSQHDEYGRDELETLAMAGLLELMQDDSAEDQGDSVVETYVTALYSIIDDEPEEAIRKLKQAWNSRVDTEDEGRIAGVAAGVALLAHVELGLESEVPDQETLAEEMEVYRPDLSEAVTAVYDACTGKSVAYSPEELIQQADTDDPEIEDLEYIVFANLLSPFVDNDG